MSAPRLARAGVVATALGVLGAAGAVVVGPDDPPRTPDPHPCGDGPLLEAVGTGQVDEVDEVLDAGADPDSEDLTDTPLTCAVRLRHTDIVALLLDDGRADPNRPSDLGTPLVEAVEAGDPDLVSLLLDAGADPDREANGDAPLHAAAYRGSIEIAELLVDAGAGIDRAIDLDVSADLVTMETPLVVAAGGGPPPGGGRGRPPHDMVDWLLDAGAAPSDEALRQASWGLCPAYRADSGRERWLRPAVEVTRLLLEAGADADAGAEGPSPLLCATGTGDGSYVDLLLQHGADPDHGGRIPIGRTWDGPETDYVLSVLDDRAVGALPDPGVDDVENIPPLVVAAGLGHIETVEQLLGAGADPNLACDGTYTPLLLAAATGDRAMVELLLDHGADPAPAVDPAVPTPAEVAHAAGHGDLADRLAAVGS